jgi:hypothetical protein
MDGFGRDLAFWHVEVFITAWRALVLQRLVLCGFYVVLLCGVCVDIWR